MAKSTSVDPIVHQRYEIQLYLASDPFKRIRLESFTVNYGLNMIPSAIARLPAGESMSRALSDSDADFDPAWLDGRTLLRIGAIVTEKSQEKMKVFFEGYAESPNLVLTRTGYELTIQLQHWMRDLAIGSVLHEFAHPQHSSTNQLWAAWYPLASSAAVAGAQPVFHSAEGVALQTGLPVGWRTQLPLDIWANGQKPIMAYLASKSPPKEFVRDTNCPDAYNSPNTAAAEAIRRIQGPSKLLGSSYDSGVHALEITGGAAADRRLTDAVAAAIAYHPLASYSGSTFWSILMRFCSQFGLAVIPRATDAVIQPIVLGLSDHYVDGQLIATDFSDLNFANVSNTTIRGVVVATQPISTTGAKRVFRSHRPELQPSGCYFGSQDSNDGLVQFIAPPFWLSAIHYHKQGGAQTAKNPRGAQNPDSGQPPTPPTDLSQLLDLYAKMRFSDEKLRNRMCQVSCDISVTPSPGSTIAVTLPDLNTSWSKTYKSIVGLVSQVSTTVDRSALRAITTVALSGVRTLEEYNDGRYSIDQHPLFTHNFSGIPLIV